jgi:polynucleotide 5'-hydroxyl-kinase GRC3/NOL9
MTVEPGWDSALDRAARSRLTLVVGDVDTGKTCLATFLANGLLARGFRVGVVDADLGQSEIGPPTTIGLGHVTRALTRLGDAEAVGLSFVGSTSPRGHVAVTVEATYRMAARAFALGLERVVVDTCGLIEGPLGTILKRHKIERLCPDLVIGLERHGECESILAWCAGAPRRPEIARLSVGAHVRRRSALERRRHREQAIGAYFQDATPRQLAVSGLALRGVGDGAGSMSPGRPDDLEGTLVGLDDACGDTLGLGAFRAVDVAAGSILVDTPVRDRHIAGLRLDDRILHVVESVR